MKILSVLLGSLSLATSGFAQAHQEWVMQDESLAVPMLWQAASPGVLSAEEQALIDHVQSSIELAEEGHSQLSNEILQLTGMSSPKVRHLLNNLARRPDTHYLEIGLWAGSTFVSALYSNGNTTLGVGIDNWSQFGGPYQMCMDRCAQFLEPGSYEVFSRDCFGIDPAKYVKVPANLYFFDGDHSQESQRQAFTHYDSVLDQLFIAIVDDWNWGQVRQGTMLAFSQLGYQVLYEVALPSDGNGDVAKWWNGLYVAVIRKP